MNWIDLIAAFCVLLASLAGVVLVLLTLPGAWLIIIVALLCQWWRNGEMFSWWTIGIAVALAIIAEVVEFLASGAVAMKAGSSKRGALWAIIGSLVGAIAGSPFFFPIGTIAGGMAGAGLATFFIERGVTRRTWGESAKAGSGAAAGRLAATAAKAAFAAAIGLLLTIAAFVP